MKQFILLLTIFIFIGCEEDSRQLGIAIPDKSREIAANKLVEILATIKVERRVDDEDWDQFIEQAHASILLLYGEPAYGIYKYDNVAKTRVFIPMEFIHK